MNIYIINLDRSADRWAGISAQFDRIGMQYQRIAAVDGSALSLDTVVDDAACRRHMGRSLRAGEAGCFLSHIKALEAFLASGDDYCVIIEDDAKLRDDFETHLNFIVAQLQKLEDDRPYAVNLAPSDYKYSTIHSSQDGINLRSAHRFAMMAMGILWSRAGAEAVLQNVMPLSMPYDNYLRHIFTGKTTGFSVQPSLMEQRGFDSEIAPSNQSRSRLHRSKWYFFIRLRRTVGEKLRAAFARAAWQLGGFSR